MSRLFLFIRKSKSSLILRTVFLSSHRIQFQTFRHFLLCHRLMQSSSTLSNIKGTLILAILTFSQARRLRHRHEHSIRISGWMNLSILIDKQIHINSISIIANLFNNIPYIIKLLQLLATLNIFIRQVINELVNQTPSFVLELQL